MEVDVDRDVCASTGQCVMTAPKVFRFEDGELVWVAHPDPAEREAVEAAAGLCPTQAIRLTADDQPVTAP